MPKDKVKVCSSCSDVHQLCDRAFSAAWPRVWYCLPTDLRQPYLSYSRSDSHWKCFRLDSGTKA